MAATWTPNSLFMSYAKKPEAKIRLFVFPPVGGGGSTFPFMHPRRGCPSWVVPTILMLPGRFGHPKRDMPLINDPETAMKMICDDLATLIGDGELPFVFFGVSLGGMVMIQLVREMKDRGLPLPLHFFVSGKIAPHVQPVEDLGYTEEQTLDRAEFINVLRKYGGTPEDLLQNTDFLAVFIPMMRSDFTLNYDSHRHCKAKGAPDYYKMDIPITLWHGEKDEFVPLEQSQKWEQYTTKGMDVKLIQGGGHYFFAEPAQAGWPKNDFWPRIQAVVPK